MVLCGSLDSRRKPEEQAASRYSVGAELFNRSSAVFVGGDQYPRSRFSAGAGQFSFACGGDGLVGFDDRAFVWTGIGDRRVAAHTLGFRCLDEKRWKGISVDSIGVGRAEVDFGC